MLPVSEATDCLRAWTGLQNEWKLSISREKTHVLHQIGVDIAAETNGKHEISCEQQNLLAHDTYDTPCQSWVGAKKTSFIGMDQGLEN